MAIASQAAATSQHFRRLVLWCLASTAALGLVFMVVKGFEYKEDIDKHLVPGGAFALRETGAQLFYGFTGWSRVYVRSTSPSASSW